MHKVDQCVGEGLVCGDHEFTPKNTILVKRHSYQDYTIITMDNKQGN